MTSRNGRLEMVDKLLDNGANIEATNKVWFVDYSVSNLNITYEK